MPTLEIITVRACKDEGDVPATKPVEDFAKDLAQEKPKKVLFTGNSVTDHQNLHARMQEKVISLGSGTYTLNFGSPTRLAHQIDAGSGDWNSAVTTVGIVYQVMDVSTGVPTGEFIGSSIDI